MRGQRYQLALISLIGLSAALYGIFVYREVFPQYRIYQNRYVEMEEFRAEVTGQRPAVFSGGIKQIVLTQDDNGPEAIDRCTSCHVAMDLEHFSPTRLARDVNGTIVRDAEGYPVKEQNPNYVWDWLDAKIERLKEAGDLAEAEKLEGLKVATVDGLEVDMTKALAMHPLIGKEERPFEYHPVSEYGCTVCHGGNGRALTYKRAHGPVFDGQYEESHEGPKPQFLERDPENDPQFAEIFNHKPGHKLLFQTTPILVGGLIEANCVQCHVSGLSQLDSALNTVGELKAGGEERAQDILQAFQDAQQAVVSLLNLQRSLDSEGYTATLKKLRAVQGDYTLTESERKLSEAQARYLTQSVSGSNNQTEQALETINKRLVEAVGSAKLSKELQQEVQQSTENAMEQTVLSFVNKHIESAPEAGSLFAKARSAALQKELLQQLARHESSFSSSRFRQQFDEAVTTNIDRMTQTYQRGEELFISQACYPCHKIAGFSRGGVGPELTYEGEVYPWFIKESIVWPQADLRTSTMPNFRLDHEELEALTTFLLAQKGRPSAMSEVGYQIALRNWEQGKKLEWEEEIEPNKITNLRYGQTIFATQGCASCHRLKGFESDIGFAVEKGQDASFDELYAEDQWFQSLFPEDLLGSEIVRIADEYAGEIDQRIVDGVRQDSILEYLDKNYPGTIESYFSSFKYALRAKDHHYEQKIAAASTDKEREQAKSELKDWRGRIHRIFKVYVQQYGLGRLIGPRLNWSGIYRSDQWLMEHFYNPTNHVPRSIMPVFPFDQTKFYALTYMLDKMAQRNLASVRQIWNNRGFNPELAFDIHCAQCHGNFRQGGGPVAEWLYPIPKSLRNANFMRNLTPERAAQSIIYGVKGGPMPPWGELPKDKPFTNDTPVLTNDEIHQMVEWLYQTLPGSQMYPQELEPIKWQYGPDDVLKDLEDEGDSVDDLLSQQSTEDRKLWSLFPRGERYFAALKPSPLAEKKQSVDFKEIFDERDNPVGGLNERAFYIKKKYYTKKNLQEGERFFVQNCAVCHGKEGGGTGLRAGSMIEAKPRMLTNLGWISTRDDLRLLRSIKFGVLGTSMTPWGDATTSLQRLQLVMYIRSLSAENKIRDEIAEVLFNSYDRAIEVVREVRIPQYEKLMETRAELEAVEQQRQDETQQVISQSGSLDSALERYQQELALREQVKLHTTLDETLGQLIEELRKERSLYDTLSASLIVRIHDDVDLESCIDQAEGGSERYQVNEGKLSFEPEEASQKLLDSGLKCVQAKLLERVEELKEQQKALNGKLPSADRSDRLSDLNQRIQSYSQTAREITNVIADGSRSRKRQAELVQKANQQLEALAQTVQTQQKISP